jgi:hypothetical protein
MTVRERPPVPHSGRQHPRDPGLFGWRWRLVPARLARLPVCLLGLLPVAAAD